MQLLKGWRKTMPCIFFIQNPEMSSSPPPTPLQFESIESRVLSCTELCYPATSHPIPKVLKQLQGCSIVYCTTYWTHTLQGQWKWLKILTSELTTPSSTSPPPRSTLVCFAVFKQSWSFNTDLITYIKREQTEIHTLGKDSCTPQVWAYLKRVEPILIFKGHLWVSSVMILKMKKWQVNKTEAERAEN